MNIISGEQDTKVMLLKQMGATVKTIQGIICYVKFRIEETEVSYIYNINKKDQFFLQRTSPYPLGAGVFVTEEQVLKHIQKDIEQFRNASKSSTFQKYIEINYATHRTIHDLEDTFMNYNVPADVLLQIEQRLLEISDILKETQQTTPKI